MVNIHEVSDKFWQHHMPGEKPELGNPVATVDYVRKNYQFIANELGNGYIVEVDQ